MPKLSKHTLIGRVHQQVHLEQAQDVEALYELIDPEIRERRERTRADEPELTLSHLQSFVDRVTSAEVEQVRIIEAKKVSQRHSGRPMAVVHSLVRYNEDAPREFRAIWVRDNESWYTTALNKRWWRSA